LIENMVYKNFLLRLIFSLIFIFVYFICLTININYIFFLIFIIYALIIFEIFYYFKNYKLIPIIYVLISCIFFFNINFDNENFTIFNLFILIVITFDIFSYISGKFFGKKKLTQISPNKTFEGLLGGITTSLFFSLYVAFFFNLKLNFKLILFTVMIIIFAFIGDIIESYFKRKNNLKNSSNLIPGHGGVFDRFDSFLFSIIFYTVYTNYYL